MNYEILSDIVSMFELDAVGVHLPVTTQIEFKLIRCYHRTHTPKSRDNNACLTFSGKNGSDKQERTQTAASLSCINHDQVNSIENKRKL